MTVIEAIERFESTRLATPESRQGTLARIAVAASGEGLDASLQTGLDACRSLRCCMALQALSVIANIAPQGTTVREAIELYEPGELEEVGPAI